MRRIIAIVLPRLACEVVRQRWAVGRTDKRPMAVILEAEGGGEAVLEAATIDVVDEEARRAGVRPGQKVAPALALAAHLAVHRVTYGEIDAALGRVAEVALAFAPTAAVRLRAGGDGGPRTAWGDAPFDTVWLDVTGAAHLFGGEEALLDDLAERMNALGHTARFALAEGPRLAQALARWAAGIASAPGSRVSGRYSIALPGEGARALSPLPVQALPIDPDMASWLVRLGLLTVGDLARVPRAAAQARLGACADEVLDLLAGRDDLPLVPYAPPRLITEEATFEEGIENAAELLFVLRGMTSRAAARLGARGEACTRLEVTIPLDRSIAALRGMDLRGGEASIGFHVDLPAPLADGGDLLRALRAKLERTELRAPAVGIRLCIPQIVAARAVQLDLSRDRAVDPNRLPALLAELSAEIGAEQIGVLTIEDAHRPEQRSRLRPITIGGAKGRDKQLSLSARWRAPSGLDPAMEPLRLLPEPLSLGRIGKGSVVVIEPQLFATERVSFVMRLDHVEWWTSAPVSRDYVRAWLSTGDVAGRGRAGKGGVAGEVLVFIDRQTGEAFLQGWCE